MDKHVSIEEMLLGNRVEGFYILKNATTKMTAAGKPFLTATLTDQTGKIDAKVWDYGGPVGTADEGKVVKVLGTVTEFRGTPQLTIEKIRLAEDADPRVTEPIQTLCQEMGVPFHRAPEMRALGEACGIAVGAAVAALVR